MEQAAGNLHDRLLIRLLFRLGCRVSEALSLKADDIDYEHSTITIIHLKTRTKIICPKCKTRLGKRHQFCQTCGKKVAEYIAHQYQHQRVRVLPLDDHSLKMLEEYVLGNRCDRVFRVNRHRAWQIVKDCARKVGLPGLVNPETGRVRGVSPHRLRDAFSVHAMKLDDSGDALRLLQEHLGHTNFNTTAKYRKIAGQEHRRWYDNLWEKADS